MDFVVAARAVHVCVVFPGGDALGPHGPLQQGRRPAESISRRGHPALALSEGEIDDVVAFLASLTSTDHAERGRNELARQREVSQTKRPQRDTARVRAEAASTQAARSVMTPGRVRPEKEPAWLSQMRCNARVRAQHLAADSTGIGKEQYPASRMRLWSVVRF